MDAIDFLFKEHDKVRNLFKHLNDAPHSTETKKKLFEQTRDELIRRESMEQTVWHPKLKSNADLYHRVKFHYQL